MYAVCACVGMFVCMWTPINMCKHTCGSPQEIPGISITLFNQGLLAEPRGHPLTGICFCLLLGGVNIRSYGLSTDSQRDKGSIQPGILVWEFAFWASGCRPTKTVLHWFLAICSFFMPSKEVPSHIMGFVVLHVCGHAGACACGSLRLLSL